MIKIVFAVKDVQAGFFGDPLFAVSRGVAVRSFMEAANNPELPFMRQAADHQMYILGEFDSVSGVFTQYPTPEYVGCALDYVKEVRGV